MAHRTRLMTSLVALAATGALLAGCDRRETAGVPPVGSMDATLALQDGTPPPVTYAPAPEALEPGQPLRVTALGPAPERYRYIDDAYEMVDAFGDSPPDYAFDYGGVEPWVWRSDEGYYRMVEEVPGGYREYYYGPDGDTPFLVRDPRYSYAYDDGALVAVYDTYGRVQPASFVARQADYAGRYYARARILHYAALHQERRRPYADQWRARETALTAPRRHWARERDQDAEWRRLREDRPAARQAAWTHERQVRAARVTQVAQEARRPDRREARALPAPEPIRAEHDRRHDRAQVEARGPARLAEAPRPVQRADSAQRHAAQAVTRETDRAQIQQRQAERRAQRGEAQAEHHRAEADRQHGQAERQRAQGERQAQRGPAQSQRRQEQVRSEPRPSRVEAPNAQAHGRPAAAQQHERPQAQHGEAQHGGPKGGGKGGDHGGDKHDRR